MGLRPSDYFDGLAYEQEFRRLTGAEDAPRGVDSRHVDCIWEGRGIDVKGLKASHHQGYILVEFTNVAGDRGWARGDADAIAFRMPSGYLVVGRQSLHKMAQNMVLLNKAGSKVKRVGRSDAHAGLYRLVGRNGRKDVFTYVREEDVKALPHVWVGLDGGMEVHGKGD
jgi:hypothetical protein